MRCSIAVPVLAVAGLATAQSDIGDLSSILGQGNSAISALATASDPGAVANSFINQITSTFNPSQLSALASVTSQAGPQLSSLATVTGSARSSALASISSQASAVNANPTSAASSAARSAVSGSSSSGSSASSNAAPTGFVAGGIVGVAGAVGAAALLL